MSTDPNTPPPPPSMTTRNTNHTRRKKKTIKIDTDEEDDWNDVTDAHTDHTHTLNERRGKNESDGEEGGARGGSADRGEGRGKRRGKDRGRKNPPAHTPHSDSDISSDSGVDLTLNAHIPNTHQQSITHHFHKKLEAATDAGITSAPPLASTIPIPIISSYNITSFSAYATSDLSEARRVRVLADITHLTTTSNIIFLQETRLNPHGAYSALNARFPTWRILYNNPTNNTGGTLIMISPHLRFHYTITQERLHYNLTGHAQLVRLTGISHNGTTPMSHRLLNLYLPTGTNVHKRRASAIKHLLSIPTDLPLIMGGDFNFVVSPQDTTNYSTYHHLKGASKYWDKLLAKHSLWEVSQDTHTNIGADASGPRTARLDRFYVFHSEADCALYSPITHVTNTTHSILNTLSTDPAVKARPHISTHMAITLSFHTTEPQGQARTNAYTLPRWVTHTPHFIDTFRTLWAACSHTHVGAFERDKAFKRTAKTAHFVFKKSYTNYNTSHTHPIDNLTASIKLLRIITSPNPDPSLIKKIHLSHPNISSLSIEDPTPLRDHINEIMKSGSPGPGVTSPGRHEVDRSEGEALYRDSRSQSTQKKVTDPVKILLPSTRSAAVGLRERISDPLTTDAKAQALMIRDNWGPIWARRQDAPPGSQIRAFLDTYNIKIPQNSIPKKPTLAQIESRIKKTHNSAPGPDGLPFAFYRAVSDLAAPIILDLVLEMGQGSPPPKQFNLGNLFVFAKDNTCLVTKTRPIAVNNSDNRILAGVVADAIMPAVAAITPKRQRGFVKGRLGEDNITELTNLFYNKLNHQKQHYLLFIDTAKAFDSIDHDYLFAVLKRIGMPSWVINVVRGLMTNARVRPQLKGRIRLTILINRGVKQGCPLSPILFILAYNPLLHNLGNIPGTDTWAFADDAVIAHESLSGIRRALEAIDAFSTISGLGVNRDKSSILHVLEVGDSEKETLKNMGWEDLSFTSQAVYLGVLVGYNIDSHDIYENAFTKFKKRALSFDSALKHMSTNSRTRTINIYLTPLFSYLFNFYLMPYRDMGKKIRREIGKRVISFNGGAYKFIHLSTPPNRFGPACPLRDLWATNVASLAHRFDFGSLLITEGGTFAVIPDRLYLNDDRHPTHTDPTTNREWNGLLVSDHIACAALEVVNDLLPRGPRGQIDLTPLDTSRFKYPKKRLRKAIYDIAMHAYIDDVNDDITRKMTKLNMDKNPSHHYTPAASFALHGANLAPSLPHFIRDTQRNLIFNALATDLRVHRAITLPHRGPQGNPFPCYLCGLPNDNIEHIFGDCTPVITARKLFGDRIGITLKNDPKHYGLACKATTPPSGPGTTPPNPSHEMARRTNATVIYNYTVWHERSRYYKTKDTMDPNDRVAARLRDTATRLWNKHMPAHWHTARDFTPPDLAILDSSPYGRAGKRTETQKLAAREYGRLLVASVPRNHHIAYTDGSAQQGGAHNKKSGPCGAGMHIQAPPHKGGHHRDDIGALGNGTNNIGELFAIGMAAEAFLRDSDPGDSLHIFSDSKLSTLILEYRAKAKTNLPLVTAVLSLLNLIRTDRNARIHWIPAHVGLLGNERADRLADDGAALSAIGRGCSAATLARRISDGAFLSHTPRPITRPRPRNRNVVPRPPKRTRYLGPNLSLLPAIARAPDPHEIQATNPKRRKTN
jgi:ribonuclease HI